MPRPKSKEELLALSKINFERLLEHIAEMDPLDISRSFPQGMLNRNVRDVLGHLHHWHTMFQDWYSVGMNGDNPDIPAKGYSWKNTPDLNRSIQAVYANTPLEDCMKLLTNSHNEVYKIIENHSDEDLFQKQKFKWTGTTSLGAYLISATSSHYDWALKLIKKAIKN